MSCAANWGCQFSLTRLFFSAERSQLLTTGPEPRSRPRKESDIVCKLLARVAIERRHVEPLRHAALPRRRHYVRHRLAPEEQSAEAQRRQGEPVAHPSQQSWLSIPASPFTP